MKAWPLPVQTFGRSVLSNLFVSFAVFYMHQPLKLDYLWAALCLLGAVYFVLPRLRAR